ncbi:MAG: plasmid maintenance system killer protein, partial [Spirochaetota bacterium]
MNVYYETRKLQKLCDSFKEAQRQMGQASAKKLAMRLQELVAASSLADIPPTPPPRLHLLHGGSEEFAVMLHGGDRLVFC